MGVHGDVKEYEREYNGIGDEGAKAPADARAINKVTCEWRSELILKIFVIHLGLST